MIGRRAILPLLERDRRDRGNEDADERAAKRVKSRSASDRGCREKSGVLPAQTKSRALALAFYALITREARSR